MSFGGYLKQSTTVTISLGPALDKDDGDTEKTGLTIQDTDVYLSKNGGAKANPNDTNDCTEDADGVYRKQLNATDTNTLGILTVYCHFTDCLYMKQVYMVVTANWYDTMCSTDQLDVNTTNIEGSDATNQIRDSVVDDATRIDASALNTLSGHDPGENIAGTSEISAVEGKVDTVDGVVDDILTDTNEIQGMLPSKDYLTGTDNADGDIEMDDATGNYPGTVATVTNVTNRVTANTDQIEGVDATDQIRDAVVDDSTRIDASALNTLSSHDPGATIGTADAGDEMNLADDAITSAKYDESTAFPIKSDDSGNTQIARTGADGDTLEDISDEIDAVPTAVENRTEMDNNSTQLSAIVGDTNEIQGKLPTNNIMGSSDTDNHDTDIDDILVDTGTTIPGLIGALNDLSAAQVQSECEDAIDVKFSFTGANVNSDPQDKAGYSLSAAGIDSILDEVVEGTLTFRQMQRIFLAALANKTTGGGTNTYTARNLADSKARITLTVDANKNRTGSVLDGS